MAVEWGGTVRRHPAERRTTPRLSHEQAAALLVDFELGRLPERQNAAVAQHVRSCPICQRQGLTHAATERRAIVRKLRHVKPTRRMLSPRARIILLLLTVPLLFQLLAFQLLHPN